MLFGKNTSMIFGVLTLILIIQIYNVNSLDPKLEQCSQKFLEQAKQIDFSHLPTCFDASKLSSANEHVKVFGNFFDSLTPECKQPSPANVKECLKNVFAYFKNHTEEVQAAISGSINALFEGSKGCIDTAVKRFSNLDEYIANGCSDEAASK